MSEAMAVALLGSLGLAALALTFWLCVVYPKASARIYPTYFVGVVALQTAVGSFAVGYLASRASNVATMEPARASHGDLIDGLPSVDPGWLWWTVAVAGMAVLYQWALIAFVRWIVLPRLRRGGNK